jgi:hypothetical protein
LLVDRAGYVTEAGEQGDRVGDGFRRVIAKGG